MGKSAEGQIRSRNEKNRGSYTFAESIDWKQNSCIFYNLSVVWRDYKALWTKVWFRL